MFRAFDMGVGMVVIAAESAVQGVIDVSKAAGVHAWRLGHIANGSEQVILT